MGPDGFVFLFLTFIYLSPAPFQMNPSEVAALPLPPGPQQNVSLDFLLGKKSHLNVQKLYQDYGDVVAVTYKDR